MSKFKALKEILEGIAPTVAKEGEEAAASIAAKTATADEKAYLDMVKQQLAERDAFKSEFNLPTAHGTSGEKILGNMNILDRINLEKKLGVDSTRDIPISEVPIFKEFKPNDSFNGMGIFSHPYDRTQESYMGPNYKPNEYAIGKGSFIIPMRVRGAKTFNYDGHINYKEADLIPTVQESFEKLSKLTGKSVEELKNLGSYEVRKLVEKYPKDFENFTFQGQVVTFKPENIRGEFAEYDPLKRKSRNYMDSIAAATTGAGAYSALSPESAEASEIKEKPKSQLKDLLKDYSPSFGSKTGDYSSYDESEALPTEGMQGQGLATIIRNIIADKKPPSEFEEGGGGIYGGGVLDSDPVEYAIPALAAAKGISKALGRGALTAGKAGLEAVESGAQALAKRYPELARRLMDNKGELDIELMNSLARRLENKNVVDISSRVKKPSPSVETGISPKPADVVELPLDEETLVRSRLGQLQSRAGEDYDSLTNLEKEELGILEKQYQNLLTKKRNKNIIRLPNSRDEKLRKKTLDQEDRIIQDIYDNQKAWDQHEERVRRFNPDAFSPSDLDPQNLPKSLDRLIAIGPNFGSDFGANLSKKEIELLKKVSIDSQNKFIDVAKSRDQNLFPLEGGKTWRLSEIGQKRADKLEDLLKRSANPQSEYDDFFSRLSDIIMPRYNLDEYVFPGTPPEILSKKEKNDLLFQAFLDTFRKKDNKKAKVLKFKRTKDSIKNKK